MTPKAIFFFFTFCLYYSAYTPAHFLYVGFFFIRLLFHYLEINVVNARPCTVILSLFYDYDVRKHFSTNGVSLFIPLCSFALFSRLRFPPLAFFFFMSPENLKESPSYRNQNLRIYFHASFRRARPVLSQFTRHFSRRRNSGVTAFG